jgi:hypothetical protein
MQQCFGSPPHTARLGKGAKNAEIFSIAVSLGSEVGVTGKSLSFSDRVILRAVDIALDRCCSATTH